MIANARFGQVSSRPTIGVTGNGKRYSPSWQCIRLSVYLAGGRPVRISTRHDYPKEDLDAVIVSGGDDIDPALYGEQANPANAYDQARDELEQDHIRFALEAHLPLLGICRGYQLINVTLGGSLHGDIRKLRQHTSNLGTILPRKTVRLSAASTLSQVLDREVTRINSLHYQAVKSIGSGLVAVGWDLDNLIQAAESSDGKKILGVQWHPEYLFYVPHQLGLFRWLVDQARHYRSAPTMHE
ncbi:MAG: gamma-glutamyl-gamma-aminobutyrate hydrolase family protein [Pseudomonadota bacterium]